MSFGKVDAGNGLNWLTEAVRHRFQESGRISASWA